MANPVDSLVSWFAPVWGVRRAQARRALNVLSYYEAAKPTKLRKQRRETGSGDTAIERAGKSPREQARHFEQNLDLARGALSVLVANTVGPAGIQVEPQPRTRSGEIHEEFARQIRAVLRNWGRRPEVTWCHDWPSAQRITARTWFRDGEAFAQLLEGSVPGLDHGTRLPLSLELMEPDFIPLEYTEGDRITQGIERNAWGRPVAFHVYSSHPGDARRFVTRDDLKRIPAARMLHVKLIDRIRQARGMTVFASVLGRFDDLKDYEESERIAAKVAASMAAVIIKGAPEEYATYRDENGNPVARDLKFAPGMIFDDLRPGEDIRTIDSKRPNPNLAVYRDGQLRAAAAGFGTTYSSLSKNYNGTYSAQRQELVEAWGAYGILSAEFTQQFVRPVHERAVWLAILSGQLKVPPDVDPETVDDALYIGPQMPWIDPVKEMLANKGLERAGYKSAQQIIRERGGSPSDIFEQIRAWRNKANEAGLVFDSDAAKTASSGTAQDYLRLREEAAANNDGGGNSDESTE